ncbi:hypothetical protein [Evtepia gabavorous]|uniref:hypothetical protein n=1 Tax=Evtepia gabavorous TaxID=2211183 RepID=UPI00399B4824
MQNISNPRPPHLTPALEGAPCSASHENRSIPSFRRPRGRHLGPRERVPIKTVTFTAHAQGSGRSRWGLSQRLGHDYVGSEHLLLVCSRNPGAPPPAFSPPRVSPGGICKNLLVTAPAPARPLPAAGP